VVYASVIVLTCTLPSITTMRLTEAFSPCVPMPPPLSVTACVTRGALFPLLSCPLVYTRNKLLGIVNPLFASLNCVPCLGDLRFILFFLRVRLVVEGVDMLHQMLFQLREAFIQTLEVGFHPWQALL
jgi:hypothetical protein